MNAEDRQILDDMVRDLYKARLNRDEIEARINKIELDIFDMLKDNNLGKYETADGKVTIATRSRVVYPKYVDEQVKEIKRQAEEAGNCETKLTSFLKFYKSKRGQQ